MAPSPAAGRQTGAPRTPTKLANRPQGTPKKLGQSAAKNAPSTPKAASAQKPQTDTPADDATSKAQETAENGQGQAQEATDEAQSKVEMKDEDEDEGPMSKVTEAGDDAQQDLSEAAPEPVSDDVDDATEGAQQQTEETAEDAGEQVEEAADDADDAATEKAGQVGESADEGATDDQEQDEGSGLLSNARGLADKASGLAGTAAQDPEKAAEDTTGDVKEGAEDAADGAEDTAEDTTDEATKVAGATTDEAGDADEVADGADETAEDATEEAGEAPDVADEAEETAEGAVAEPEDAVDGVQEDAEGAAEDTAEEADGVAEEGEGATEEAPEAEALGDGADMPEGLPIDLSVLKGLEVQADGTVQDAEGNAIGKLAEGDAEDLEGYPIGDNGEILDDDGDLVGRVELMPDEIKKQLAAAKEEGVELPEGADEYLDQLDGAEDGVEEEIEEDAGPALPSLSILEGLTCQIDGLIYDSDGNTVGKVVDGDPEELQNATLNDQGEFINDDGEVVGHAAIHEDAEDLVAQGVYEAEAAPEEAGEEAEAAVDENGEPIEGVAEEAPEVDGAEGEGPEEPLEGIEDQLPGIEALQGRELDSAGEIRDEEGNLLGQIEDEELKQKIADGDINPDDLKIDEDGNVVDEEGNVLGKTELAEGAQERLAKVAPTYDIRILDGKKVNKKGKILDDDGEEIGQLIEGDVAACSGKKVNEKGEVVDKSGNVIGKVGITEGEAAENATKELLEELGEIEPEAEAEPEAEEEAGQLQLPGLDTLEGLKVNKKGQILNEDGEPIGELTDGDLAECAGKKCNDKGEVLDKDGNVVGRVKTLLPPGAEEEAAEEEQPEEEGETGPELPPLSILEGLTCNKSGKLVDANGTIVGELVEGDAKKLSKSGIECDAEGQFWDTKGHVIGRAITVAQEDPEEESPFAGLEGLIVVADGFVEDENGNKVGYVTEGDAKKLIGRAVDEDGDIIDKKGSVVGHAERYEEPEVEEEVQEEVDLSFLKGKTVNKAGMVIGDDGIPVARLVEGNPKEVAGRQLDDQGQLWNDQGQVIGRVELIPDNEREAKPEGPFAGLEGLHVNNDGQVADENDYVVGEIVEGNPKQLIGMAVDEDGDIVDKYGNVKGHAERLPEVEEEVVDNSILNGKVLNKQGYVVDENGIPFGRLIEGNVKELAGRVCDENGYLYNDTGKVVGRCEVIPENERVSRPEGPFAGLEGLRVVKDGKVEDADGNVVGEIVEGNPKRLVGMAVDEDGDIIDKYGNVKGHADPWEEEEEAPVDLSALAGCTINKAGNAVDGNGTIIGRVVEGDPATMIGKKVDGQGQIWDNAGNVIGKCDLVLGEDTAPEGPFAGFEGLQINKDGTITTPGGDIVGRIIEGDIQKLLGHTVDEDGDINDKNGNVIGRAERWEPEEKERRVNPMSGRRVNKEGEVRDENGDLMGRLTMGDLGHCVNQEIDDNGNVVDQDGNKIGEVTLEENIVEEEYEGPTEEELAEAAKREEERDIAEKMGNICSQTLERMQPICKQITEHMEKADRTPKEELDEDALVDAVKPLIEEGGRVLQECNGSLRGLDPDGHIAAQAKGRAGTKEATPEEYRLAENLKELTTTVVTTIDNAKKKLNDMPHAKKKLNPLWGLLTQPLFQILAAVGLLLAGVLGLVGQLLNGLGLGGLVNGLLGGLGIDKLLSSFGLGGGGDKKKKGGNPISGLPIVGGLLGSSK